MKYNFNKVIERKGTYSAKLEETEVKFGRTDIIPMWIADMDYEMATPVVEALVEKARHGIWGYTSRDNEYYEAVNDWMKYTRGWDADIRLMSHALGGLPMLANIVHSFMKSGDRIIVQPPVFQEFKTVIDNWGLQMVCNPLIEENNHYTIDFDDLKEKAKIAKFMIFCNPHNPMGRVWTREEVEKVANICLENDVLLISDEMFGDMMLFGAEFTTPAILGPEIASNTIVCTSIAKTFNMAGLQVATCILPTHEMKEQYDATLAKLETKRNNAFSIHANKVAMNECRDWFEQVMDYIGDNLVYSMNYIDENIPQLSYTKPEAAYLLWLDFRALNMDQTELSQFLINKAKIGMSDGSVFGMGGEGFMRMNLGSPRAIVEQALEQLKIAIDQL